MIVVRPSLSKVNHKYFTFLPKEGCDYLAAYLNRRLADDEEFTPTTPVIATKTGFRKGEEMGSQFMTTRNVSKIIRKTMRPRFTWRPYVLRAYFDTQMLLAESHGKIAYPYRVFFMSPQRRHRSKIPNKQGNTSRKPG